MLLDPDGHYDASQPCALTLNGAALVEEPRSVCSLFGLWPGTSYRLAAEWPDGRREEILFETKPESFTLNVRAFGAKGDGVQNDTAAIQAAILCCPEGGRVLIPEGNYLIGPLFLKSHITLEIKRNAVLSLITDRSMFPILPGKIRSVDEQEEYLLGSWEGNPLPCFAGALTGVDAEDVQIIGEGVVDGCATAENWWKRPKEMQGGAYRSKLLYLARCRNITVQGLTFRNSPSWNLHPCFSQDLQFLNVRVEAPAVSPNTDGFDPESCRNVRMYGTAFSVGDDCIAIKSGKIYMGMKYHTPCEQIEIAWCAMLDGHGGVTIGSEMSGGVRHVRVHHCLMRGNDRGLRIKTRRGRGKNAVVDDILFEDVEMQDVKVPLVINSMYYCDPDGKTPYVQSRDKQPVDDRTPTIGRIVFERVRAEGCTACAGYVLGLPERPMEHLILKDCFFRFRDGEAMIPAMAEQVEPCQRRGLIVRNAAQLTLDNVKMDGVIGPEVKRHDLS